MNEAGMQLASVLLAVADTMQEKKAKKVAPPPLLMGEASAFIPKPIQGFQKTGSYKVVDSILSTGQFAPIFITGAPGCGKSAMVRHIAGLTNRPFIQINMSDEMTPAELFGGWQIIDGDMIFREGPVLAAARLGAILLLDEIDSGANSFMLQQVLEGGRFVNPVTGAEVIPASGFTIVATGNTSGQGDTEGVYVGTSYMNQAFMDRFICVIPQPSPTIAVEANIVKAYLETSHVDAGMHTTIANLMKAIRGSTFVGAGNTGSIRRSIALARMVNVIGKLDDSVIALVFGGSDATTIGAIQNVLRMVQAQAQVEAQVNDKQDMLD